ncbi:MAG TPA: hypothetical protein VFF52_00455 [Isosphaeraceae bacterium]|nr:hypothetical protein [Isosphaeraceae bacterium]
MCEANIIFGYFSPETVLPLTSIVATIAGAAMLLTRGSLRFFLRCLRIAIRREKPVAGTGTPHFHGTSRAPSEQSHH